MKRLNTPNSDSQTDQGLETNTRLGVNIKFILAVTAILATCALVNIDTYLKRKKRGLDLPRKPLPTLTSHPSITSDDPNAPCGIDFAKLQRIFFKHQIDELIQRCEGGKSKIGNMTMKSLIPGHEINQQLVRALDKLITNTGYPLDNEMEVRTMIAYDKNGKTGGIPSGKIYAMPPFGVTTKLRAKKGAGTTSEALISIPININPVKFKEYYRGEAVNTLATELCQSRVTYSDTMQQERVCNDFGLAAVHSFFGRNYQDYLGCISRTVVNWPGQKEQETPGAVPQGLYEKLLEILKNQPDVLTKSE